jgi:tRNA G18 (ribose-2'-O)-methylase SpoU
MNKKLKLWELDRVSEAEFKQQKKNPIVVILDDIRSLNNIGSFFRTADAFNIEKIYLCGITACPPHKDTHKTALGATETIEWEHKSNIVSLCEELRNEGYSICSIEQTEETVFLQNIHELKSEKFALVFGNEVNGVNQEVVNYSDTVIEIPQFGTKHSLNVSVCAGIVLWEFCKKYLQNVELEKK